MDKVENVLHILFITILGLFVLLRVGSCTFKNMCFDEETPTLKMCAHIFEKENLKCEQHKHGENHGTKRMRSTN